MEAVTVAIITAVVGPALLAKMNRTQKSTSRIEGGVAQLLEGQVRQDERLAALELRFNEHERYHV